MSARWELSPSLALKAGLGLYSEGARNGDAARPFGNPEVLPERAWQATLGAEVRPLHVALEVPERRIIEAALKRNAWNRQATAGELDINRTTLYKKMRKYRLDVGETN